MGSSSRSEPRVAGARRGRTSETTRILSSAVRIPRIELHVETEAGVAAPRSIVIDSDRIRIGSHPSNELVLTDRLVSRFHCELKLGPHGWVMTDTGSSNGTRVNGTRARDADLEMPECRLDLGESSVRVRELESASEAHMPMSPTFGSMLGCSVAMRRLFELVKRAAKSDSDVLIEGESGTGKELVTRELVSRSPRADKPFVVVDCGAIAPNLIESELFGHTRGAFTGAERSRVGAFEEANGGTVFLDEIGELPLEMQPKLLRALAEREIRRMGENQRRKVDVRVIAATNRKLEREINQGRFREDLYFRLSVVTLRLPPLRERLEDIPLLVHHFLSMLDATSQAPLFTDEVFEAMRRYDWPGNVRELRNHIERRVIMGGASLPTAEESETGPMTPGSALRGQAAEVDLAVPFKQAKDKMIESFERAYLKALLDWSEGNVSRAARKANIDRVYLHRLLQHYGLKRGTSLTE